MCIRDRLAGNRHQAQRLHCRQAHADHAYDATDQHRGRQAGGERATGPGKQAIHQRLTLLREPADLLIAKAEMFVDAIDQPCHQGEVGYQVDPWNGDQRRRRRQRRAAAGHGAALLAQRLGRIARACVSPGGICGGGGHVALHPAQAVSYTHLDVYKRQALMQRNCACGRKPALIRRVCPVTRRPAAGWGQR